MTIDASLSISDYQAIVAPFLMMTSSAALVWALQNRFSRLVQGIRTLKASGYRDDIDYRDSRLKQIDYLSKRTKMLRNSIASLYVSMCLALSTAIFLTIAIVWRASLEPLIVGTFITSLALLVYGLSYAIRETQTSFDTLEEEMGLN